MALLTPNPPPLPLPEEEVRVWCWCWGGVEEKCGRGRKGKQERGRVGGGREWINAWVAVGVQGRRGGGGTITLYNNYINN